MNKASEFIEKFFKEEHLQIEQARVREEKIKEKKIQSWINVGTKFFDCNDRLAMIKWVTFVKLNINLNREVDLHAAIILMKALNHGFSFAGVKDILYCQCQNNISYPMVKNIVTAFCPNGKAFYKEVESKPNTENIDKQM